MFHSNAQGIFFKFCKVFVLSKVFCDFVLFVAWLQNILKLNPFEFGPLGEIKMEIGGSRRTLVLKKIKLLLLFENFLKSFHRSSCESCSWIVSTNEKM